MTTSGATTDARYGWARPGGRTGRVRAAVLAATLELLAERGYEAVELPEVARRAGVHPTTVYRRWRTKARLVGEALLEQAGVLSPTPDTGSLRGDLERLLTDGVALARTPPVRALFEVLLSASGEVTPEVAAARDRFWSVHLAEARSIVERGVAGAELPGQTDATAVLDLVIGPALLRGLFLGQALGAEEIAAIVERALVVLRSTVASPA